MKDIPLLVELNINVDPSGDYFILLTDGNGETSQCRVTPDIINEIAVALPRFANQLANSSEAPQPIGSAGMRVKADALEMSSATVNVDVLGSSPVLSIKDNTGVNCSWQLSASLARELGEGMLASAEHMSPEERQSN